MYVYHRLHVVGCEGGMHIKVVAEVLLHNFPLLCYLVTSWSQAIICTLQLVLCSSTTHCNMLKSCQVVMLKQWLICSCFSTKVPNVTGHKYTFAQIVLKTAVNGHKFGQVIHTYDFYTIIYST